VHKLPADLRKALIANTTALDAWNDITPLARNEFICWVEDAKQEMTREGVVALGEAEAGETVNPRFGQIARASSSKATATRRVTVSSTPRW
jgi:uncharacterized protein YdeI (YjbR/CyaY-like superfamily)